MAGIHLLHELPSLAALAIATVPALPRWWGRPLYAAAVLGAWWCVGQVQADLARRWPAARHGETLILQGRIASLPEPGPLDQGLRTWRFRFRADDPTVPLIRAAWYRAEAEPRGGECWRLELRLRVPHGSLNPGGFDYEAWLFRQGIGALATVRGGQRCAGGDAGAGWLYWRQALRDRYAQWLPGHPGLPLLAAMTMGDDSALSDADWEVFRLTGTTHLVAISGFNVAIVAGVAFLLGRWLWAAWPPLCLRLPAQKAGMLGAAAVGVAYAFLAGWEPPVQRAALMLVALLGAAWFDRLRYPARTLAVVWVFVLLIDSPAIASPGLWLSFGAVAMIFYVTRGRLQQRSAPVEALRVQAALSLALVPLSLLFFQGTSWLGPVVNGLAVPVVSVLTPLALAAVGLAFSLPAIGIPLLGVTASAFERCAAGLSWVAAQAADQWVAASPPLAALLLASVGLVLLFAPRGLPLRPLAVLLLVPLLWPPRQLPQQGFTVAVLDVGQGLSVLVRTSGHVLLYDAGPAYEDGFDAGASVVAPYVLRAGLRRIDRLVVSHGDQDHAGGVPALRRRLGIVEEIGTRQGRACVQGERWHWDGVDFEFLHPRADETWSDNEGSCVLRVSDAGHSLLLAGDVEKTAEQHLVQRRGAGLRSQLLVSPHHGSRSASSAAFVSAVSPAWVVHSAGWRNRFGHPRPEVVQRYAAIGARQYVTGVSGALLFAPEGPGWKVESYRERAARWWNAPAEP